MDNGSQIPSTLPEKWIPDSLLHRHHPFLPREMIPASGPGGQKESLSLDFTWNLGKISARHPLPAIHGATTPPMNTC